MHNLQASQPSWVFRPSQTLSGKIFLPKVGSALNHFSIDSRINNAGFKGGKGGKKGQKVPFFVFNRSLRKNGTERFV